MSKNHSNVSIALITHLQNKGRLGDLKETSREKLKGKLHFSGFKKLCTSNKKEDNINRLKRANPKIVLLDEKFFIPTTKRSYEHAIRQAIPSVKIVYISPGIFDWSIVATAIA